MPSAPPVTKKYSDVSGLDSFRFIFRCDRCGAPAESETYRFSTEGLTLPINSKARALLWTRQHGEAYERANSEARFEFNRCPACGRRVCDQCFYVSGEADTDICHDCKHEREIR